MPDPITILAMAVLLGVVILVHEWGHFIAAKSFGVRVDVFSIGFGKRLWGWRRGATDYRVSLLPLGGYVKMAGDNPMEERAGAPDEFLSKPRWQRAVIAVAGPAMNVVLGLVLLVGMYLVVGIPYPAYLDWPVEVVGLEPESPAAAAGIRVRDSVVEIAGTPVANWQSAYKALASASSEEALNIVVEREGAQIPLTLMIGDSRRSTQLLGYAPHPPIVEEVSPGGPADRAGLRSGDRILAVDDAPIQVFEQFTKLIQASGGRTLKLTVRRAGRRVEVEVTPAPSGESYRIGMVNRVDLAYEQVGFVRATEEALGTTWSFSRQIVGVVAGLFRGSVSIRELGGVVEIASQSGRAAKEGLLKFVQLTILISLNLAILNLLPIPILDGGHLLMLSIEGIMRRDLSLAVKERFVQVGFVFLMVIFVVVMYNDIVKRLPKSWW